MSKALIDQAPAYDMHGKVMFMVRSGGYVMVKRPRCAPFVLTEKEWRKLPKVETDAPGHGDNR
jgi:hypothetical protein